jgi:hypothetical protein
MNTSVAVCMLTYSLLETLLLTADDRLVDQQGRMILAVCNRPSVNKCTSLDECQSKVGCTEYTSAWLLNLCVFVQSIYLHNTLSAAIRLRNTYLELRNLTQSDGSICPVVIKGCVKWSSVYLSKQKAVYINIFCFFELLSIQLNPLRPSGNYMNHLLWQSVMLHFVFIGFVWFSL